MINCPVEGCEVVTLTQRGMNLHLKMMHAVEEVEVKPPEKSEEDTPKKTKRKTNKKSTNKKKVKQTFSEYIEGDKVTYAQVLEMFGDIDTVRLFNRGNPKKSKLGNLDEIIPKKTYKVTWAKTLKSGWVTYRIRAGNFQISWYEGKRNDGTLHRTFPKIVKM